MLAVSIGSILIARHMSAGDTLLQYEEKRRAAGITADVPAETADTTAASEDTWETSSTVPAPQADAEITGDVTVSSDTSDEPEASEADEVPPTRVNVADGFSYEEIPQDVYERMLGVSYPEDCEVELNELRYCHLRYVDFDGNDQDGELVCNSSIAQDLCEIFSELYAAGYRIESIRLIDDFDGDDTASMAADNTSCFNYRTVEGSTHLSRHAFGMAIDVNPFYNPYVTWPDGEERISPPGSEAYADRSRSFPYKIDRDDLCYRLFTEHGFTWGGDWNSVKDYQHFQRN